MPIREFRSPTTTEISQTTVIRAHVMIGESVNVNATAIGQRQCKMTEELPILKGILKGVVNYHNAPVRFGRVPKREKARILAAMQQSSNSRSLEKQVYAELENEQGLIGTVIRAHIETCDFTRDKIEPVLMRAKEHPSFATLSSALACPLNPNPNPSEGHQEMIHDFSKRFSPIIRGVVEFAKRIPGFCLLQQDDQVTLLKSGVFEVLLVRLACMFDAQTATMVCLDGQMLKKEAIHSSSNARFLMDSMFEFADRVNCHRLSDAEIGLFSSVVVIAADRHGLRNGELVERMHNKLKGALRTVLNQNRPGQPHVFDDLMKKIADLRTLNTLHSEKLYAFKMTEQKLIEMQQEYNQQCCGVPHEDDTNNKSPAASSWSSSSDVTMDEAKSPLGSVSSTESMGSSDANSLNEYHHSNGSNYISPHVANAPLLAATLAGGYCPHRHRANSGSTSSGDDEFVQTSHLIHNGLTITPVTRPIQQGTTRFRKLDSPTDSGIESGTERVDKPSAPTSLCSSPRSSIEDHHIVEDMPVLKRVLQAPPLYDTNSLMDEAYKPHKKFRALRNNRDSEAEPAVTMSPHQQQHSHLLAQLSAPPQSSLSSTHSTLAKTLREAPKMTVEQMKRTDLIHSYIMRSEQASPLVTASPTACPYKPVTSSCATSVNNNLLTPAWATSVITTARQPQHRPSSTSPILQYSSQQSPEYARLYHPQSPHSTSPTPSIRSTSSPHSTIRRSTPNMLELQVDIADSQQPLNLSKRLQSPLPRPMKFIKLEVN